MPTRDELILARLRRIRERGYLRFLALRACVFGGGLFLFGFFGDRVPVRAELLALICAAAGVVWASCMYAFMLFSLRMRERRA